MNLLYIGPFPPPVGGATLWSEKFCNSRLLKDFFKGKIFKIDTSRKKKKQPSRFNLIEDFWLNLKIFILLLFNLITNPSSCIMWGVTNRGVVYQVIPTLLLLKIFHKRIIVKIFGGDFDLYFMSLPSLSRGIVRYMLKKVDVLLPETRNLERFFERLGVPSQKCFYFPNFYKEPDIEIPNGEIIRNNGSRVKFIFLSQIREEKGIFYLLDAAKLLLNKGIRQFDLHIYGPIFEDIREKFKRELAKLPKEIVIYCGVVPYNKIYETFIKYDVMVFPSFYIGEGYPAAILEAMACGLPIIVARSERTKVTVGEIVVEGYNGIYVKAKDSHSLASAMEMLIMNHNLLKNLKMNTRRYSIQFSENVVISNFLQGLNALIDCSENG